MTFVHVKWRHDEPDNPREIYSELDDNRWEQRKIEIFPDGRWGYADGIEEVGGSVLGEAAYPALAEINADRAFEAAEIGRPEFEALWAARRYARRMTNYLDGDGKSQS